MKNGEVVGQILSKHPEISKEDLLEKLHEEREKAAGLISDEVLLKVIAAELGVEMDKETVTPNLSTEHLIPGLNDVTVVGRVVAIFRPKTFEGRRSGKVGSLIMVDQKDLLRVVLWNEKADLLEEGEIKVGEVIRFSHGYTKRGYSGKVELNMGDRSEVELHPEEVRVEDYPTVDKFVTKIGEVTRRRKNKKVNLKGVVENVSPVSEFERDNSRPGKVMRVKLADQTGNIPVVVWNEQVDRYQEEIEGEKGLKLVNGKVREASKGGVEVHVNKGTYLETFKPELKFRKIEELKERLNRVNVEGTVDSEPMFRTVNTHKGNQVRLASFELKDETGSIRVSAWRKHASTARKLKPGQKVIIKNAYVKEGYRSQWELSTRSTTQITPQKENPVEKEKTEL